MVGAELSVIVTIDDEEYTAHTEAVADVNELALVSVEGAATIAGAVTTEYNVLIAYFSEPVEELNPVDVEIREVSTDQLFSVEKVDLSSDGMKATITLTNSSAAGASVKGLSPNVDYNMIVTTADGVATKEFSIPAVADNVTVLSVDPSKGTLKANKWSTAVPATTTQYNIPEIFGVDYNGILGQTVTIKFDKTRTASSFSLKNNENVIYGAFKEVIPVSGDKYLQDLATEEKYYVQEAGSAALPASVEYAIDNAAAGWTLYGTTGTAAAAAGFNNNDTFKYGKLVLNDNGTIKTFIHLTDWSGSMIVADTNEDYIIGVNKQEQTLKDYTILEDGASITVDDIEAGDVVFYNTTYKFAEVYTDENEGELEAVYDGAKFKFDGKDREGANANYYDGSSLKAVTTDYLKALKAGGEDITVYYDRSLTPVFVLGEQGENVTTTEKLVLTAEGDLYVDKTENVLRLKGFNGETEVTEDMLVSKITEIDFHATTDETWKTSLGKISATIAAGNATKDEKLSYTGTVNTAANKDFLINQTTTPGNDSQLNVGQIVTLTKDADGVVTKIEVGTPVPLASGDTYDSIATPTTTKPAFKAGYATITDANGVQGAAISSSTPVYIVNKGPKVQKTTYGEFTGSVSYDNITKISLYYNSSKKNVTNVVIDNTDGAALGDQTDGSKSYEVVITDIKYLDEKVNTISVIGSGIETTFDTFGSDSSLKNEWKQGQIVKATVLKDGETLYKIEAPDGGELGAIDFNGVETTGSGSAYVYANTYDTDKKAPVFTQYTFESDATIVKIEDNAVSTISLSDLKSLALKKAVKYSLKAAGGKSIDTIVVQTTARAKSQATILDEIFTASAATDTIWDTAAVGALATNRVSTAAAVVAINSEVEYKSTKKALAAMDIAIADYNAVSTGASDKFDANNTDNALYGGTGGTAAAPVGETKSGKGDYAVYTKLKAEFEAKGSTLIVGAAAIDKITGVTVAHGANTVASLTAVQDSGKLPTSVHVVLANGTEKDINVTKADWGTSGTALPTSATTAADYNFFLKSGINVNGTTYTVNDSNSDSNSTLDYVSTTGPKVQMNITFS